VCWFRVFLPVSSTFCCGFEYFLPLRGHFVVVSWYFKVVSSISSRFEDISGWFPVLRGHDESFRMMKNKGRSGTLPAIIRYSLSKCRDVRRADAVILRNGDREQVASLGTKADLRYRVPGRTSISTCQAISAT
jgi:hypothetical protein